jgi:ABC-type transport system involved in multi-copper enzyme maturation permease subunit
MNWDLWKKQIQSIARLELKRHILARRWIGIYILAIAPILLMLVRALTRDPLSPAEIGGQYAAIFQFFILRFAIFFSCAMIFSQMFRGEFLEKTLHFYLLVPVRREVVVLGKYVSGVIVCSVLFGMCTAATFFLIHFPSASFRAFFLDGPGVFHLVSYVAVAFLGCITYGAVFVVIGLLFRNPSPAMAFLLAWESFSFLLTPLLQRLSVVYYLQLFCPVPVGRGPLAVVTEPFSPILGAGVLALLTFAALMVAGRLLFRAQVTYSAD